MISVDICGAVLVYLTGGMSQLVKTVRTAKKSVDKIKAADQLRRKMEKAKKRRGQCESAKEALGLVEKLTACLLGHDGLAGAFAGAEEIFNNLLSQFASLEFGVQG